MESTFKAKLFLLASLTALSSHPTFAGIIGTSIQWVDVINSELFFMNLDPAGIENGVHLLMCRAFHEGLWITGKVYTNDKLIVCVVPNNGNGHQYVKFQVMVAPRGSTSWLPKQPNIAVPQNAIPGGSRPGGKQAYICRTYHSPGILIVGKYEDGVCYCEVGMKEFTKQENLEILVVNEYGLAIGANRGIIP